MTGLADLDLFPPGVRLVAGRRRAPLRGVRHDVAGFCGITERGPVAKPVRVESEEAFRAVFGGPVAQGLLAPSIALFFRNGGRAAWIVRVADLETAVPARLRLPGPGNTALDLIASSPGCWGNSVSVLFFPRSLTRFDMRVEGPAGRVELWRGLSFEELATETSRNAAFSKQVTPIDDAAPPSDSTGAAAGGNSLLQALPGVTVESLVSNLTERRTGTGPLSSLAPSRAMLSGGTDGLTNLCLSDFGVGTTAAVGLRVLEEVDEVAILALPDLVWQAPLPVPDAPQDPKPDCPLEGPPSAPEPTEPVPPPEKRPALSDADRALVRAEMVAQARRQRDRVAIFDCEIPGDPRRIFADGADPAPGRRLTDGDFGALFFPWLKVDLEGTDALVPPSGAVAGIYARTTLRDGPHRAPANEPVAAITGLAYEVDDVEHARLNGAQVNAIRRVPGLGLRVMGARTRRADGPYRQIAIRRLVNFIVETLEEETAWLVFETNDTATRSELERVVRGFLDRIWRRGMLDGARPEDAYRVRADQSVNPPESIAAGRLTCTLALRPPWPAEWVRVRLIRGDGGFEVEDLGTGGEPGSEV